jgi:hypothetical protein
MAQAERQLITDSPASLAVAALPQNRKPKAADPVYPMIAQHMALSSAFEKKPNGAAMLEILDRTQELWRCKPISRAGTIALLRYVSTLPNGVIGTDLGESSEILLLKALCKESASALEQIEVRQ